MEVVSISVTGIFLVLMFIFVLHAGMPTIAEAMTFHKTNRHSSNVHVQTTGRDEPYGYFLSWHLKFLRIGRCALCNCYSVDCCFFTPLNTQSLKCN